MLDYCQLFILINVASTLFAQIDYCQEGLYGNNCELKCPKQCRPLQTFPCNKKTGKCSEGCTNGYYGDKCDITCSCPSGICFQESGECIGTGTTAVSATKNTTPKIMSTTAAPVFDGVAEGWRTIAIVLIIFIILLVCGGVMMFLCVRLRKQENSLTGTWEIRFCKAAEAKDDKRTGPGNDPLLASTDGQREIGDQSGETLEGSQQPTEEKLMQKIRQQEEVPEGSQQPTEEKLMQKIRQQEEVIRQAEAMCEKMKRALSGYEYRENVIQALIGLSPISKSTMSTMLLMSDKGLNRDYWLLCPDVMFDKETVNVKVAHIDDNMVLCNIPDKKSPGNNRKRLQQFQGVICTGPLVNTGIYQYFEAVFDISLHQRVGEGIIAQFGFCGDKDKEPSTQFIDIKKPCFVVEVASSKNQDKICMMFIYKGKTVEMKELMNNVTGSRHRIHIGIRLKKDMKRIRIFECREAKSVLGTDIDIGEKIWPMFAVCTQNEASVTGKLIAGRDIEMWKEKKETIKSQKM